MLYDLAHYALIVAQASPVFAAKYHWSLKNESREGGSE